MPGLDHRRFIFGGEVALDGRIRPIKGAIALAAMAQEMRCLGVVLPADNAQEASVVAGTGAGAVEVFGVRTLAEVVGLMNGTLDLPPHPPTDVAGLLSQATAPIDFAEIRGQEGVKRAIVIAAAGSHNIIRLWARASHGRGAGRGLPRRTVGHNFVRLCPSGGHRGGAVSHPLAAQTTIARFSRRLSRRGLRGAVCKSKNARPTAGRLLS